MLLNTTLTVGNKEIIWGKRTLLMGILNLTPDSFSGDGLLGDDYIDSFGGIGSYALEDVLVQARDFVAAGVDILDIGGESTRPGASPIAVEEEIRRVIPVIQELSSQFDVLLSVDTYKHQVAKAALEAGADIVNDVWGLQADPELAPTIAKYQAPVILMHNRSSWVHAEIKERLGGRYVGVPYEELIADIKRELLESIDLAQQSGISADKIILDPGIGFGKTVEQNLELIDRLPEIRALGYPILLGPSRKSFIGYTLDLPVDQRMAGTAAAVSIGIDRGADIIRVHDVEFMVRVMKMTDALVRRGNSN
jgi:dihydropteroate synthase